ncbi:hypothetical protein [Agromyces sp. Marseille-P2726]|uniref:hypothetical protein n=1 Tax=Agromyces sp. Marseille-P2726 TaxID=2709132 RepID=UPI00156FDD9C|nr:hypothetical protein [Agromyces sp. Marseille-P2726]
MPERTVKIHTETDRMAADLAHVLRRTKKDVVRDAVRTFIDLHEHDIRRGAAASAERAAAASGSTEGARLLAAAGGDLMSLPLRDRLTVVRSDLLALLARHGGRSPRIIGDRWRDDDADLLELLVETDLTADDWHVLDAIHDAQRLLGVTVQFHDVTALGLVAPDRLERLEREAVPL